MSIIFIQCELRQISKQNSRKVGLDALNGVSLCLVIFFIIFHLFNVYWHLNMHIFGVYVLNSAYWGGFVFMIYIHFN